MTLISDHYIRLENIVSYYSSNMSIIQIIKQ